MSIAPRSALSLAVLALALSACGDDATEPPDEIDPNGTDHTYVVSKLALPSTASESTTLGLDIDDKASDGVDNQLGMLLSSIRTLAPDLDLQASLDAQVDQGGIILLANVKANALDNAPRVGLWIYEGANPSPTPCADPADTVCRKHLAGTGTFDVSVESATDSRLAGTVMAGTFKGGPGNLTLSIALSDGPPIDLPLQRAKAEVAVSASGFGTGSKLGGAIAQADLDGTVYPGLHTGFTASIDADCTGPRTPPGCGCEAGSRGAQLLGFLDGNDDCSVTVMETRATFNGILTPDIDLSGDGVNDAVSIGVGVSAVRGTFTVPPSP